MESILYYLNIFYASSFLALKISSKMAAVATAPVVGEKKRLEEAKSVAQKQKGAYVKVYELKCTRFRHTKYV